MFTDATYLAFNDPLAQPFHFVGLELVVVASFVLTLRHAVTRYRAGDRQHLIQWLIAFSYGIVMELIAFNYLNNYDHGQFAVQLYHRKLPLYVVCLYPTFHYTGLKIVERWRLGALPEALLTGLAICLLDVPFDVAGVDARWWSWSGADPNLSVRWLGVPVTSFYWYLLFGAVYALLCRTAGRRIARRSLLLQVTLAPPLALAVVALGTLCFQPYHGLVWLGLRPEWIVAAHVALCGIVGFLVRPSELAPSVPALLAIPLALDAWHLVVVLTLAAHGQLAQAPAKLALVAAASLGSLVLLWPARRRRAAPALERIASQNT